MVEESVIETDGVNDTLRCIGEAVAALIDNKVLLEVTPTADFDADDACIDNTVSDTLDVAMCWVGDTILPSKFKVSAFEEPVDDNEVEVALCVIKEILEVIGNMVVAVNSVLNDDDALITAKVGLESENELLKVFTSIDMLLVATSAVDLAASD